MQSRKPWPIAAALALGLLTQAVPAAEFSDSQARKFFNEQGCNGCHAIDDAHLAPAFRVIAGRYAGGGSEAVEQLALKIRYGGAGNWGVVPMISNPKVTADESHAIATWILTLGAAAPGK